MEGNDNDVIPEPSGIQPVIPEPSGIRFVDVDGARLEVLDLHGREDRPSLLLVHEGLGSVSMWRDFPARLAAGTGCRTVAYSREGFGRSSARREPFTPRFMHDEAQRVLPALRRAMGIHRTVVVGHSTGASMALLHAAHAPGEVAGIVAMAPLIDVEPANVASIRRARALYAEGGWRDRLARHHDDVDAVFRGWSDTWLDPGFASWSIEADLARITAPIVAILGRDDEYSTPAQLAALARGAVNAASLTTVLLDDCGHAPHRDNPRIVLDATRALLDAV